jgi:hypothetical protein
LLHRLEMTPARPVDCHQGGRRNARRYLDGGI